METVVRDITVICGEGHITMRKWRDITPQTVSHSLKRDKGRRGLKTLLFNKKNLWGTSFELNSENGLSGGKRV